MDTSPHNKPTASSENAPPAVTTPASAPDTNDEKSWGDKYKHKALGLIRNVGINYIVNAGIATLGTYALFKSPKANGFLQKGIDKIADGAISMGAHKELGNFLGEFLVRTQLLLCGGHILLPPLKSIHDHRKHLEFEVGHKLDVLQETFGRGNAATKRNIAEYSYIKDMLRAKPRTLSDDDKALLAKHCIGDNFQFNEKLETCADGARAWRRRHYFFKRRAGCRKLFRQREEHALDKRQGYVP
jgi:hypothetical protein